MKKSLARSRVLVTGASSGIGRALCAALAKRGANLVITARRAEALDELAVELNAKYGATVIVASGDITSEKTRFELLETVDKEFGALDLLVNNAGAGAMALAEETQEEILRQIFDLNFFAPFLLARDALPLLRRSAASTCSDRPKTTVVFLSSVVGLRGTPHYGAYGAAKSALANFADAFRAEIARDKIGVLTVFPGTTNTEFFDKLLKDSSRPTFPKHEVVTPEFVAERIVRAVLKEKHRIVPHKGSAALYYLNRFCPNFIDRVMAKYR